MYKRQVLGVQKYTGMLENTLARSKAAVKVDDLWETATVVLMGLQAVLDGARLPDVPAPVHDDGRLDLRDATGLVMGESGSGKVDRDVIEEAEAALRGQPAGSELCDDEDCPLPHWIGDDEDAAARYHVRPDGDEQDTDEDEDE